MKKILFFPGAFNPPHLGHSSIIEMVLSKLSFDELWIMPSGKRDDKTISTTHGDRHTFGKLFVEYVQSKVTIPIKLLTTDIDNIDGKLPHSAVLKEVFETPNADIRQLIGSDGFLHLYKKLGDAITKQKFVIIKRPGYDFPNDFSLPSNVVVIEDTSLDISSTQIREMVKNGDNSYKKLLPATIAEYIENHNPYRE